MKRSKILLITMLLLSAPALVHAQDWSLKAGANLSNWSGDDVESSDSRLGYQLGLQYRIKATDVINIVPGIQFTQRGAQDHDKESYEIYQGTEITYEYSMKVRMNYLEFPLSLEYQIDPSLYLMVRPSLSFLLKNNYSYVERQCLGEECTGSKDEDKLDSMRNADFGLGLGAGYIITENISISVGYQWGLLSLDDEGESEAFNRTLDLSIEYRF